MKITVPAGQDALLARLRVESALQATSLQPAGLPADAILVIRQVSDHRLGQLAASRTDVGAALSWARTLDSRVAQMAARAVRPLAGPVPPDAAAVIFADRAEMLACLALDWLGGELNAHWWWRSLFPQLDFEGFVPLAVAESAPDAPAAFEALARLGRAVDFARRLEAPSAQSILSAVLLAFDLRTLERGSGWVEAENQIASYMQSPQQSAGVTGQPLSAQVANPFSAFAPESDEPGLTPEARDLLGVTLGLRRVPALLRSEGFAARVTAWQAAGRPIRAEGGREMPSVTGVAEPGLVQEATPIAMPGIEHASSADFVEETPFVRAAQTGFGGVFYLLNLSVYMQIYNDFTRPSEPGWGLSPWDLLALLGRHWLGEDFEADPLWALLAHWAGRDPAAPPAEGFTPPLGWEVPFLEAGLPPASPDLTWLERLAHYLRARLVLALGFDDLPRLFARPAQVIFSATRLDVHFSLVAHPLEVRLAGLDRDLGWLPAAGFAVYYHFE